MRTTFKNINPTTQTIKQISFCFLLFILIISCKKQVTISKEGFTNSWLALIEESDSLVYNNSIEAAKKNIVEGFKKLNNPTVLDSCYYYSFWQRLYKDIDVNYDKALSYNDTINLVLVRNNAIDKYAYMAALVNYWRGDMLFQIGDYKGAYDAYFTGKEIAQKEYNPCELGNFYYRLAMVLYKQERYEQSVAQFKECIELSKTCKNLFKFNYRIQEVYDNIGLCFFHQKKNDSALKYYQKALDFIENEVQEPTPFQDTLYEIARGVIYGNMGSVYETMQLDSYAVIYYKKNISINKVSNREIKDAIKTQIKLASLYLRNHEQLKFWYAIDECRALLNKFYDPVCMETYLSLMANHLLDRDSVMALQFFLKAKKLNDSLQVVEKNIKAIDLNAHINELVKEHKMEELQQRYNQKIVFLTIASVVAALAIIGVFLIAFYMKRLKSFIKLHSELNDKMSLQKQALENTIHKLEVAYKEKDKILNIVAHDLRSPINSIYALADLLSQDASLHKDQQETIKLIKTACTNSLGLSKEILEAAILMQSKELNLAETNINELLAATVSLLRFRASEKQIQLDLQLTHQQYHLTIDKDKIERVINNLITNAIKFSKQDSTVFVSLKKEMDGLLISVKDFGIGIPQKIQPKIFDTFTEAKREGTSGEKAYGLGLSISKQIVETHGGRIWFESDDGIGTTFHVFLPFSFKLPEL